VDLTAALIILAREGGHIPTREACRRLRLSATDLLALRRRMLAQAVGQGFVPDDVTAGQEDSTPAGGKEA
jgi:hypothetical protein